MATSVDKLQGLAEDLPGMLTELRRTGQLPPMIAPAVALAQPLLEQYLQRFCSQGPEAVDAGLDKLAAFVLSLKSDVPAEALTGDGTHPDA